MSHRLRLAALAAAVLTTTLALSGCSGNTSGSGTSGHSGAGNGSKVIAFVPGYLGIGFYNSVYAGIKDQAKKYGYTTIQQGSAAAFSASAQTPYVRAVCSKKPAVLIIAPTDPTAMRAPIQDCITAGVKVVVVDTTLTNTEGVITSIQSGNEDGGKIGAEFIAKKLGGKGLVSVQTGSPQANTQAARVKGAQAAFASSFPAIKQIPVIQNASVGASQTSTTAALVAHPDLAAIFDVTGFCTGQQGAVEKAGKNALVVCFDSSPAEDKLLKSGKIAAEVVQPAYQEGTTAVDAAYHELTGKGAKVPATVQLKDVLITAEDANKPEFQKYFYKQ